MKALFIAIVAGAISFSSVATAEVGTLGGGRQLVLQTPPLVPAPDGILECRMQAANRSGAQFYLVMLGRDGTDVSEFEYSSIASPAALGDGLWHWDYAVGSTNDSARSCRVIVRPYSTYPFALRRGDVSLTLTSYDANLVPIATMEVH